MSKPNDSSVLFYACNLCLRLYTLKEDLRGHMVEYHNYQLVTNDSGGASKAVKRKTKITTNSEEFANLEYEGRNEGNGFKTELRPMPFKSFRLLLRSKLLLRCDIAACAYKFESPYKLEMHMKCHPPPGSSTGTGTGQAAEFLFKCFKCDLGVTNWRQCSAHLWKTHQIDIDMLHCPICDIFKAHTTVHVWRHMRVHKKWRPVVLRTLRAVQKRRQQRQLSGDGAENNLQILAKLELVRTNKNKYYAEKICEICNRKFVNGKTLSKHVKTVHNKIKPFICNICGMKTARKASLLIHMRQHTGEKPLSCKNCKFSTRDPSVLKKHQQRHNKNGLINCNYCKYICIQTISLKRHIRLKHPEEFKKIACDLCNFVTTNNENLSMHKEDHRRGLILNADDSMDASRGDMMKAPRKIHDKNEMSADCFLPLESIDSLPHDPPVDTGGVTIPAPPSEDTQFPTYLNN